MNDKKGNNKPMNIKSSNSLISIIGVSVATIALFMSIYLVICKQPRVVFYNHAEIVNNITNEASKEALTFTDGMGKELLFLNKKVQEDQKLLAAAPSSQRNKIIARINRNRQIFRSKFELYKNTYMKAEKSAAIKLMKSFEKAIEKIQKAKGYRSVLGVMAFSNAINPKDDITDAILFDMGIEKKKKEVKEGEDDKKADSKNKQEENKSSGK